MTDPCPTCGTPMRPLLTSWFCPNDCDRRGGPPVTYINVARGPASHIRYDHVTTFDRGDGTLEVLLVQGNCSWMYIVRDVPSACLAAGYHVLRFDPDGPTGPELLAKVRGASSPGGELWEVVHGATVAIYREAP